MIYLPHKKRSLKKVLKSLRQVDKQTSFIYYKGWLITFSSYELIGVLTGVYEININDDDEISMTRLSSDEIKSIKLAKTLNSKELDKLTKMIREHYYLKHRERASFNKVQQLIYNYNEELKHVKNKKQ